MNTTQLECFLAVADFLNFSRAAEHLHITQPAVSHQISSLEDELGAKLFLRTSKTVQLTQAGHLFTQYAGEILKLSRLSAARLKEAEKALPQRLGIGCRNFLELELLKPALRRLRTQAPELMPALRVIPFASLENLLEEGDIQLLLSLEQSAPPRAVYRELTHCPLACVCAPDHPLAELEAVTSEQLYHGSRIVTCPPSVYPPALLTHQNRVLAQRGPDEILFCDNLESVCALVEAGYGFAVLPDLPFARLPGLCYVPLPEVPLLSFGAFCSPGRQSPALRTFLALLSETLSGQAR